MRHDFVDLNNEALGELNKHVASSGFNFNSPVSFDAIPSDEGEFSPPKKEEKNEIQLLVEEAQRNKIRKLKARIEAILFLSDKPRGADSIAQQANADADLVRQCLSQLVQEYEERAGGLAIDCANGYCMQIADEFEDLTEDILPIELRSAVLRTLSTIALKEPMLQTQLVQIRGAGIYEHVKELIEMGLVKRTKEGHSHLLHTTKFFTENFKLSQNGIELQKILKSNLDVEFIRPGSLGAEEEVSSMEITDSDREKIEEIKETIEESSEAISF